MNSAISGGLPPTRHGRDDDDCGGDGEIASHSDYGCDARNRQQLSAGPCNRFLDRSNRKCEFNGRFP
jgi:hypothetical protein